VLVPQIAAVLKQKTKSFWLSALEAAKVPCGPINTLAEVFDDPQVQARAMVDQWSHPLADDVSLVASPLKLSATPVVHHFAPPRLGEHTDVLLREVLGLEDAALQALRDAGTIA